MNHSSTPLSQYHQPAEWEFHESVWLAWPSDSQLWGEALPAAQTEFTALCRGIADPDVTGVCRGEKLNILLSPTADSTHARAALKHLDVRFYPIPYGDIWLRDTAPLFVESPHGLLAAQFQFNGWGNKYDLPGDSELATRIAETSALPRKTWNWILEGGSIDTDGENTFLTTAQCLLNPNRNPRMSQKQIEKALQEALGAQKTLWLENGLINDHTDGHVDTIARFVAPGKVICMKSANRSDPNAKTLSQIQSDLEKFKDAQGRALDVVVIPSPGEVYDDEGELMPASYVNFYIANTTVIVPTYGTPDDAKAVELIAKCFPDRKTIGSPAKVILEGGGAFHCITQQQPAKNR